MEVMLPFYESLPEDQIEGLQHDRDFDCPKVESLCLIIVRTHLSCHFNGWMCSFSKVYANIVAHMSGHADCNAFCRAAGLKFDTINCHS